MKQLQNSWLVVVEGMDNSGKTTLIKELKTQLSNMISLPIRNYFNEKIYFTAEPYGPFDPPSKYSQISELIFSEDYDLDPETETLLFLAARREHLSSFIIPKLSEGALVFCDRFFLSSLVYQSYLKGVDKEWLSQNMKFISKGVKPKLTFIVESVEDKYNFLSLQKKLQNRLNKFDRSSFSYGKLNEGYKWAIQQLQQQGEEFVLIPASLSQEEKVLKIIKTIEGLIKN